MGLGHSTREQVNEDAKKIGTQENGSLQMPLRQPHHGPPSVLVLTEPVTPGIASVGQCLVSGLISGSPTSPSLHPTNSCSLPDIMSWFAFIFYQILKY